MELLFLPIAPFIWHPERIFAVAVAMFVIAVFCKLVNKSPWYALFAGACWVAFGFWEAHCKAQRYDIRVDLMLIVPVLLPITFLGFVSLLVNPREKL